jgi:hypothetical protein
MDDVRLRTDLVVAFEVNYDVVLALDCAPVDVGDVVAAAVVVVVVVGGVVALVVAGYS